MTAGLMMLWRIALRDALDNAPAIIDLLERLEAMTCAVSFASWLGRIEGR